MTKEKILKILYENEGKYVSNADLKLQLHISETELMDLIQSLKDEGYPIDSSPEKGFSLTETTNLLLPYEIKRNLYTDFIGQNILFFKEVDSTNEVAKNLAAEGAKEGTLVMAESQKKGKGRRGKKWVSPSGGIWMTIILRPDIPPEIAPHLTLVTGVAVAETLDKECSIEVGIKWPNDILIGDKKVCGILTELSTGRGNLSYVVVGIGIDLNVDVDGFPPDLREGATSLKLELNREIHGAELVQRFLQNFETRYKQFNQDGFNDILKDWRKFSKTIGSYVEIHKKGRIVRGEAVGINHDGVLILEQDDGALRKIISGECFHIPRKE
jgi:BirA family transcriptional regulator, biotin operon repressor / biotin---[acetyl-CoA-carboxylase] ligase